MEASLAADFPGMSSVPSLGTSMSALQAYMNAAREAQSSQATESYSQTAAGLPAVPAAPSHEDAADQQQRMLHFISHIDAECFISLLQMQDPPPMDSRDRAEYRRRYHQLREALVIPLPPGDSERSDPAIPSLPIDPRR
jgi:hypothetical protein